MSHQNRISFTGDWTFGEAKQVIRAFKGQELSAYRSKNGFVLRPKTLRGYFDLDVAAGKDLADCIEQFNKFGKASAKIEKKTRREKSKRQAEHRRRASQRANRSSKVAEKNNKRRLHRRARGK